MKRSLSVLATLFVAVCLVAAVQADPQPGERPALSERLSQDQIVYDMSLPEMREAGARIFATPFNKLDGLGDGPMDPDDSLSPGGRPSLQGNSTFLRVNGLDSQSCMDCHGVVSSATIPPLFGIGGAGTANNNAIIRPSVIEPGDLRDLDGSADFNGRFANPPFVFGAGGVELLAQEMTRDLQALKAQALANPGTIVPLHSKGISFGTIQGSSGGGLETDALEGIGPELVVRPFGRKGEFATTREFARGAMEFHFGIQPTELVGEGIDGDADGVLDELSVGELSAISVFMNTLDRPYMIPLNERARDGFDSFREIGCASCHIPLLQTEGKELALRSPEVPEDPSANVYMTLDMTREPAAFRENGQGGIVVPLFADLKLHDMGEGLAESFAQADETTNRMFTTARLWGVADSAPYLHDGRATTLTEAILMHGGEGQASRDAFDALVDREKIELLAFLRSLRTPRDEEDDRRTHALRRQLRDALPSRRNP